MRIEVRVEYPHEDVAYEIREFIKKKFEAMGMKMWASGTDGRTYDMAFDWYIDPKEKSKKGVKKDVGHVSSEPDGGIGVGLSGGDSDSDIVRS